MPEVDRYEVESDKQAYKFAFCEGGYYRCSAEEGCPITYVTEHFWKYWDGQKKN